MVTIESIDRDGRPIRDIESITVKLSEFPALAATAAKLAAMPGGHQEAA